MKLYWFLGFVFCIISCLPVDNDDCNIEPFNTQELLQLRDSLGIKSGRKFRKFDMSALTPIEFLRYLSSVKAFEELGELKTKGYLDETLFIPYRMPTKIKEGWINRKEQIELMELICSKKPAIPVMSNDAASFPEELSTVGIEALHLRYYSEGNECAFLSNKDFCLLEEQDSLVIAYKLKFSK